MGILSKEQIRELIREKNLVTADDIQNMLKEMFSETLQEMLEAELDTELGYPKNGVKPDGSDNRRNGHISKKVRSSFGELDLTTPRDRDGEFEPTVHFKQYRVSWENGLAFCHLIRSFGNIVSFGTVYHSICCL